jgi:hypothetical protein
MSFDVSDESADCYQALFRWPGLGVVLVLLCYVTLLSVTSIYSTTVFKIMYSPGGNLIGSPIQRYMRGNTDTAKTKFILNFDISFHLNSG